MRYIHYGSDHFDISLFGPIECHCGFNKPYGGLWASPVDSINNWKTWCEDNDFHLEGLTESFIFTLSDSDNILKVSNVKELNYLYELHNGLYGWDVDSLLIFNPDCMIYR